MMANYKDKPHPTWMILFWALVTFLCISFWHGLVSLCFAADGNWIPKDRWSLLYTNSENIEKYDEKALNAFDGNPGTFWMSRWLPAPEDPHPHEIQIDLGASYLIDGFSYLPRQSTVANGQVKGYLFYVSEDPSDFGVHVAIGSFGTGIDEKIVNLGSPKKGRYISFVSTSEQKVPSRYSNAAEIGVRGVSSVEEFLDGNLKVIFDPSPDVRATGHSFYWTDTVTGEGVKTDLKKETTHIIPEGTLKVGETYKFTATAYGLVDGKAAESVHSDPLFVRLRKAEEPIWKPSAPRIIGLRWEEEKK